MSGHQYGQFGPARGGPYGWRGKLMCCLVPLLTLGLLGLVPSLLLALRRRRAVDVVGAVVFGLLTLTAFVTIGLLPADSKGTPGSNFLGGVIVVLWLAAPVHFLVLDSLRFWGLPGSAPAPFVPVQQQAAWHRPTMVDAPPASAAAPAAPVGPAAPAAPAPAPDDLQQLGELLRRQVQDRRP